MMKLINRWVMMMINGILISQQESSTAAAAAAINNPTNPAILARNVRRGISHHLTSSILAREKKKDISN